MDAERPRPTRNAEIEDVLRRKEGGVAEAADDADKYTVLGAASRRTFGNWLTPVEEHFVCHRNDVPDADDWTIALSGHVDGALSLADLEEYPTVAVAHTMECAGNGRGQHRPRTGSVQWGFEAAGTAFWTGTPVSAVLRDHGLDVHGGNEAGGDDRGAGESDVGESDAGESDVGESGADDPGAGRSDDRWLTAVGGDPSEGDDVFARSIPLSKALADCVLATEMNGRPLPPEHGYPVRLVVPGWYGVNSVKWVEELRVMDTMVVEGSLDRPGEHAVWHQEAYRIHPRDVDPESNETVGTVDTGDQIAGAVEHPYTFDQTVMSVVGVPDGEAPLAPGADGTVEVRGVAWAGDDAVARVEVSTDGGETWADAELFGPDYAGAWRLFRYDWDARPGTHTLHSRATDERGRHQPRRISEPDAWRAALDADEFPWNAGGYAANAYEPNGVEVVVAAPK